MRIKYLALILIQLIFIISIKITAADEDGDTLTYSLSASPAGMTIDPQTGLISWTPSQIGDYPVTIEVTDPSLSKDTKSFFITVLPDDKEPPKAILSVTPKIFRENDPSVGFRTQPPADSLTSSYFSDCLFSLYGLK